MAAINGFKDLLALFKEKGLSGLVNDFIAALKAMPSKLNELWDKLSAYWEKLMNYIGIPWVATLRKIYKRVTWFIDDIKTDVMAFYNVSIQIKLAFSFFHSNSDVNQLFGCLVINIKPMLRTRLLLIIT